MKSKMASMATVAKLIVYLSNDRVCGLQEIWLVNSKHNYRGHNSCIASNTYIEQLMFIFNWFKLGLPRFFHQLLKLVHTFNISSSHINTRLKTNVWNFTSGI